MRVFLCREDAQEALRQGCEQAYMSDNPSVEVGAPVGIIGELSSESGIVYSPPRIKAEHGEEVRHRENKNLRELRTSMRI